MSESSGRSSWSPGSADSRPVTRPLPGWPSRGGTVELRRSRRRSGSRADSRRPRSAASRAGAGVAAESSSSPSQGDAFSGAVTSASIGSTGGAGCDPARDVSRPGMRPPPGRISVGSRRTGAGGSCHALSPASDRSAAAGPERSAADAATGRGSVDRPRSDDRPGASDDRPGASDDTDGPEGSATRSCTLPSSSRSSKTWRSESRSLAIAEPVSRACIASLTKREIASSMARSRPGVVVFGMRRPLAITGPGRIGGPVPGVVAARTIGMRGGGRGIGGSGRGDEPSARVPSARVPAAAWASASVTSAAHERTAKTSALGDSGRPTKRSTSKSAASSALRIGPPASPTSTMPSLRPRSAARIALARERASPCSSDAHRTTTAGADSSHRVSVSSPPAATSGAENPAPTRAPEISSASPGLATSRILGVGVALIPVKTSHSSTLPMLAPLTTAVRFRARTPDRRRL